MKLAVTMGFNPRETLQSELRTQPGEGRLLGQGDIPVQIRRLVPFDFKLSYELS